jgi:hypothetical protein
MIQFASISEKVKLPEVMMYSERLAAGEIPTLNPIAIANPRSALLVQALPCDYCSAQQRNFL